MLRRCDNPSQDSYRLYGARGISVCDEWKGAGGFEHFLEHVGPRPSDQHSIDRIDNSKGYEPGNVRWADRFEQAQNRSTSVMVELNGKTQCVRAWERELGIKPGRTGSRMHQGWPLPEALLLPKFAPIDPSKVRTSYEHPQNPQNARGPVSNGND